MCITVCVSKNAGIPNIRPVKKSESMMIKHQIWGYPPCSNKPICQTIPKCCKTEKGLSQNDVKPDGLKPHFHQENSHTLKTESLNFIGDKMGETNKSLTLREIQKCLDVATISDSMKSMVIFHRFWYVYQRVNPMKSPWNHHFPS